MPEKEHVALTKCYFCGESDKILLAKTYNRTKNGMEPVHDLKPFHGKVVDMEPCQKCADYMKQGIILIGIDEAKSTPGWNKEKIPNPYRTGPFLVVKEEAIDHFPLRGKGADNIRGFAKKYRFMFVEHEVLEKLGILPKEDKFAHNAPKGDDRGEIG